MSGIVTPKIEITDTAENYGRFVVEPLERGFGVTLGNALRRVLLSSLPGAAVTAIRIEEVAHEFSTIPHVKEDATDFMLNVKGIRLRSFTDRPGKLTLEVAGEGRVCAGDIKPSADYEIVNPELHLATLDSAEAKLTVEFYVEGGKGYQPAAHGDGLGIGVIPVDGIFTPVHKVNYTIENTRVGQVTNYDRLVLEVWTDGTISATEAVSQSARILVNDFTLFVDLGKPAPKGVEKKPLLAAISPEKYNMPLEELKLQSRTLNCLRRAGITRVGELLERSKEDLFKFRNFGEKSWEEVQGHLVALGLTGQPTAEEPSAESGQEEAPAVEEGVKGEEGAESAELKEEAVKD